MTTPTPTDPELALAATIVAACERKGSGPAKGYELATAIEECAESICALIEVHGPDASAMVQRAVQYAGTRATDRKEAFDLAAEAAREKAAAKAKADDLAGSTVELGAPEPDPEDGEDAGMAEAVGA